MVYLDLANYAGASSAPSTTASRTYLDRKVMVLSRLEMDVVLLARSDGPRTLRGPQRRLASFLLGARSNHALADPRLEALQRYVVQLRHGMPNDDTAVRLVGFSDGQLAQARRLAQPVGTRRGTWLETALPYACALVAWSTILALMSELMVDDLTAILATTLLSLSVLTLFATSGGSRRRALR